MTADRHATAMVFDEPGKPLRAVLVPLPDLGPGEVLVRVCACTVCGSDLHTHAGRRPTQPNVVLGHEIVGVVDRLAPEDAVTDYHGNPLREGDRVVWAINAACGSCDICRRGFPQKCTHQVKYGHTPLGAQPALSGGLSTHCHLVRQATVFRVPDALPDLVAAQAACATATAAACLRAAGEVRDSAVLVFGAGLLGLSVAAMARHQGARAVVVTDMDSQRLALAERFGATLTVPSEEAELRQAMLLHTGWNGFDIAVEMSGATEAVNSAIGVLGIGGRAILAGTVLPTRPAEFLPEMVVRGLLTIRGVHNYLPSDLALAMDFLHREHQRYPFADLVTRTFPLADAEVAFQYAQTHRPIRVAVIP